MSQVFEAFSVFNELQVGLKRRAAWWRRPASWSTEEEARKPLVPGEADAAEACEAHKKPLAKLGERSKSGAFRTKEFWRPSLRMEPKDSPN